MHHRPGFSFYVTSAGWFMNGGLKWEGLSSDFTRLGQKRKKVGVVQRLLSAIYVFMTYFTPTSSGSLNPRTPLRTSPNQNQDQNRGPASPVSQAVSRWGS